MNLVETAKHLDLDALYREFETDNPIVSEDMTEILRSFNDEKNQLYSITVLTNEDGHSRQYEFFENEVYEALKNNDISPEFINAFYIDKRTNDYSFQINMYLNSKKVSKIISRKAGAYFNREKELREMLV